MRRLSRLYPRDWIGLGFVLVGFILRLRQYLTGRSLWLDEAMLTNNILSRDFAGLFQQLSDNQGAPIGFLLLQKSIMLTLGDSEYALRLIPFAAGILSLAAMFALTRKVAYSFAGSLALAFFAVAPALIYYASEAKQYSSDVAITLGLSLLYLKYARIEIKPKDAALLGVAGALAIWFSHPAVFVVAAMGLTLFLSTVLVKYPLKFFALLVPAVRAKETYRIVTFLLIAALWGLSFGALYTFNLRQLSTHQFFLDFWRAGFMPHDASALIWLANSLEAPFRELLGLQTIYGVTVFLFLMGFIRLAQRVPRFGLFLLFILFLSLLASFLTLYPFAGRMILFLVPILILSLSDAVEAIAALFKRQVWFMWAMRLLLAGYLLFGPLSLAWENFATPKYHEHIRPTMEYLRDNRKDGDLVYVYHWAEHAARYYAPKYGFAMSDFIIGTDHHAHPEEYRVELDSLRGNERVWFLFSHVYESDDFNERDFILSYLDSIGELSREYRVPGTSVYLYLYDLR